MHPLDQDILTASILIVDDQAANVHLLRRLLGDAGYTQVMATMDPLQVCSLHREHDFDLILLDLQLPVMDGFQVMAALQAGGVEDFLPVIVLTAQPGHKLRALQAGARDFISKPFDLLEVKTRIHNMLAVQVLYRRLEAQNRQLEQIVQQRTAELRESEARYRSLTELASDWYWEQDEQGAFTKVSGPVLEMLGLSVDTLDGDPAGQTDDGWNQAERAWLRTTIASRQPFLDYVFSRTCSDGHVQQYRVSGEPIFNPACRLVGYRGVGIEVSPWPPRVA